MQEISDSQKRILFPAIYVLAIVGYSIAGVLLHSFLIETFKGHPLAWYLAYALTFLYLGLCAMAFYYAPLAFRIVQTRRIAGGFCVFICAVPLLGSILFEREVLTYIGNSAQLNNQIDLEKLPEVKVARDMLANAERHYNSVKSDTLSAQTARVALAGLSLELVKLDTSQAWDRSRKLYTARREKSKQEQEVQAYQARVNAASAALEREKANFKAVWNVSVEKYGQKSWAQVSGEKSGFNPVMITSNVLSTVLLILLSCFHVAFSLMYKKEPEKVEVKKAPEPVVETKPEVVKPEYSPEFCQKYKDVDYVLRAIQLGHTTLRPIEQATMALGHRVNISKVSQKIFPLLRKPDDPQLVKFIKDWEARSGKKVDEICKNGHDEQN